MTFRIDVNLNFAPDEVVRHLSLLIKKVSNMAKTIDDLVDAVAAQSGKIDSMKTFIGGLETQIRDALANVHIPPAEQAKLDAVFDGLTQNTQAVADAIDSDPDTPAAPIVP